MPVERIHVTGIPVREEFRAISHRQGGGERRLLIMGGGLGLLPRKDAFYEALNDLPGVRTTILTGRNQRLYERLSGRYEHIEVVGFTDRVWEFGAGRPDAHQARGHHGLREHFCRASPAAVGTLPPAGKNNARFLLRAGLARSAAKETEECLAAIQGLLYDDRALEEMSRRMRERKRGLSAVSLAHILTAIGRRTGGVRMRYEERDG